MISSNDANNAKTAPPTLEEVAEYFAEIFTKNGNKAALSDAVIKFELTLAHMAETSAPLNMRHIPTKLYCLGSILAIVAYYLDKGNMIFEEFHKEIHDYVDCEDCGTKATKLPPTSH